MGAVRPYVNIDSKVQRSMTEEIAFPDYKLGNAPSPIDDKILLGKRKGSELFQNSNGN